VNATEYTTIQAAVDAAASGDVIVVYPGVYRENVVIVNKTLTLMAYDPNDKPVVIGGGGICFNVTSLEYNDISISGFVMRNCTFGIWIDGVVDVEVSDNVVREFNVTGISIGLFDTVYGDVQCNGNVIISAEDGVYGINVYDVYGDVEVNGNTIRLTGSSAYGIYMDDIYGDVQCNGNDVSTLGSDSYGIYLDDLYNDG